MDRRRALSSCFLLGIGVVAPRLLAAERIVVVVGEKAKVSGSLSTAELEAIFTTRKNFWSNGDRIIPLNLPPKHPIRVAFDRAVLHMDPDEVARYWIDRRVRGGARPPKHVPSPELLAKVLRKLPGAIGYLPHSVSTEGLKIVAEVER